MRCLVLGSSDIVVQSQMVIQDVSCSLSGFFFRQMKLAITVLSLSQSLCKGHTGKHFQRQKFWVYTELGVVLRGPVWGSLIQAGLKLTVHLHQPPHCQTDKCTPPRLDPGVGL